MFNFDFTKTEYDYYIKECPFTEEELVILSYRRLRKSIIFMADELNLSERTIKRRIKSIHKKIIRVIPSNIG